MKNSLTIFGLAQALCITCHKYGVILYHSDENIYDNESLERLDADAFKGLLNDGVSFIFFEDYGDLILCHNLLVGKIKHDLLNNFGYQLDNPLPQVIIKP